eukprot:TRINITY_DN26248_c0_g1_i1.p2 TRINITY_DN26248_c0_g1~~TRINITY_DN26248_c0_g1_i1.p2  ORF type:complete len:127 (-),score=8.57 TRINITY_DN26248_c0_g1_i1:190-570(-)
MPGVLATTVGYTGGRSRNPSYESVCNGDGHTEAIRIVFDPTAIGYGQLVDKFLASHDPTRPATRQYMSAVWPHTDEQETIVHEKLAAYSAKYRSRVVTRVLTVTDFHEAEEYHQKYLDKRGGCALQ